MSLTIAPGTQDVVNMHTLTMGIGWEEMRRSGCLWFFSDITFEASLKADFLNSMTFLSASFPDETQ